MAKLRLDLKDSYPIYERRVSHIPLIGYRAWSISSSFKLKALTASHTMDGPVDWNPKKPPINWKGFIAATWDQNLRQEDYIGFFALKNPELLFKALGYSEMVYARVSLYGTVIEHDIGFRAQRLRIDRLWINGMYTDFLTIEIISTMEETYQCDVDVIPVGNISIAEHRRSIPPQIQSDFEDMLSTSGLG